MVNMSLSVMITVWKRSYGHLSKQLVDINKLVKAGEPIALGGNIGRSTGWLTAPFETRLGIPINPALMFDFESRGDIVADFMPFRKTKGTSWYGSQYGIG